MNPPVVKAESYEEAIALLNQVRRGDAHATVLFDESYEYVPTPGQPYLVDVLDVAARGARLDGIRRFNSMVGEIRKSYRERILLGVATDQVVGEGYTYEEEVTEDAA